LAERTGANNVELRPVILAPKVLKSSLRYWQFKEVGTSFGFATPSIRDFQ
jgi:hypothetical protein